MKPDIRWTVISCVELIVAVGFLIFLGMNSWSSSESSWALIALFIAFMALNGVIGRLFLRAERRRGLRHR